MAKIRDRAAKLFDTGFQELITPDLIKVAYVLGIAAYVVFVVVLVVGGFGESIGAGVLMLVLSPLIFALGFLAIRVCLEVLIVFFRLEGHLRELSRIAQKQPHSES
jgi:hypothetical protein